ncbi:MAG: hypothetical protein P1V20_32525 [Verrucomicrobiales bacterium]|nr:hypothetical protein [Verrucomicrobiales bacterium]
MLTCTPKGICSYDYLISGKDGNAELIFDLWAETGEIRTNDHHFYLTKRGLFSGKWSLETGSETLATAEKYSALTRQFDIMTEEGEVKLRAESAFTRNTLLIGDGYSVRYYPVHAMTRRATISGEWKDFKVTVFGFWLTALTWKRAQQSSTAGS